MARRKALASPGITVKQVVIAIGVLVLAAVVASAVLPVPKGGIDFRRIGTAATEPGATVFRDIRWYELGPEGWDPYKEVRELQRNATGFVDSDARAVALLKKSREIWDNAPINPAMNGAAVRIPGYVVPLDEDKGKSKEFLLVPYFGACIHTPPPPSNQILHVKINEPVRGLRSMDTYWVSGRLQAARSDTSMGVSGFTLDASSVERYTRDP